MKKADENSSIMSFDDMVELAEQSFFKTKYGTKDDPYSATITEIKLAYAKQPVKNDLNTCQVVPVWDFIGTESYKEADKAKADHKNSNFEAYLPTSAPEEFIEYLEIARECDSAIIDTYSILRINAISGDYIHDN